jgi:hypothetical protein
MNWMVLLGILFLLAIIIFSILSSTPEETGEEAVDEKIIDPRTGQELSYEEVMADETDETQKYDSEKISEEIFPILDKEIQEKYSTEHVKAVLDLQREYYIRFERESDDDEKHEFIWQTLQLTGLKLGKEDIEHILEVEDEYVHRSL